MIENMQKLGTFESQPSGHFKYKRSISDPRY